MRLVLAAVFLAACVGTAGPPGPQGDRGPAGDAVAASAGLPVLVDASGEVLGTMLSGGTIYLSGARCVARFGGPADGLDAPGGALFADPECTIAFAIGAGGDCYRADSEGRDPRRWRLAQPMQADQPPEKRFALDAQLRCVESTANLNPSVRAFALEPVTMPSYALPLRIAAPGER